MSPGRQEREDQRARPKPATQHVMTEPASRQGEQGGPPIRRSKAERVRSGNECTARKGVVTVKYPETLTKTRTQRTYWLQPHRGIGELRFRGLRDGCSTHKQCGIFVCLYQELSKKEATPEKTVCWMTLVAAQVGARWGPTGWNPCSLGTNWQALLKERESPGWSPAPALPSPGTGAGRSPGTG